MMHLILILFMALGGLCLGANTLYDKGRKAFCDADIDLLSDDIRVSLVDSGVYTINLSTDEFYDDIPGGAIVAESDPLTTPTTTAGVFDADDVILAAVPAGQDGHYLILWKDTGTPATSRIFGRIDTGTGLPVTPNGGDINIAWNSGSSKIFKL